MTLASDEANERREVRGKPILGADYSIVRLRTSSLRLHSPLLPMAKLSPETADLGGGRKDRSIEI